MTENDLLWMRYSIEIAQISKGLCVGVVAIRDNTLIYCAHNIENNSSSWLDNFLKQVKENEKFDNLYLSINTISEDGDFDLNKLLRHIAVNKIYIGLPDHKLEQLYDFDPLIKLNIDRYPDELQKLIVKQNYDYYMNSKQNIQYSPYYANVRISNLIIKELSALGIEINKRDLETHKKISALIEFILQKYKINSDELTLAINKILSKAFGEKYSSYDYSQDIRSLSLTWENNFYDICKKTFKTPLSEQKILNVGVGSGDEAKALFCDCRDIIFVDIARQGLHKIKSYMPFAKTLCSRAENLLKLKDNSYD